MFYEFHQQIVLQLVWYLWCSVSVHYRRQFPAVTDTRVAARARRVGRPSSSTAKRSTVSSWRTNDAAPSSTSSSSSWPPSKSWDAAFRPDHTRSGSTLQFARHSNRSTMPWDNAVSLATSGGRRFDCWAWTRWVRPRWNRFYRVRTRAVPCAALRDRSDLCHTLLPQHKQPQHKNRANLFKIPLSRPGIHFSCWIVLSCYHLRINLWFC